jgi:DNA polymerase III alpha subunit (gram-positive type)
MAQQRDPFAVTPVADPTSINWSNALYVVFDLETTSRSRRSSEIIASKGLEYGTKKSL